jgi:hypothetical protein
MKNTTRLLIDGEIIFPPSLLFECHRFDFDRMTEYQK